MPVTTSTGVGLPTRPSTARLSDVSGQIEPARPEDVERRLAAGTFVWLDLANPDPQSLQGFGDSLGLDDATLRTLTTVAQHPSFTLVGDSIQAVVPSTNPGGPSADIIGIRVVFTERFLLTAHSEPCSSLDDTYQHYGDLLGDEKADNPFVLFHVLDQIVDSFVPDLLQLDRRLDNIQVTLLGGTPPGVQGEVIKIRRVLSEALQAFGWYVSDLGEFVDNVGQLPGMSSANQQLFVHHRSGVIRIADAAKDYRDETQDALGQVAANVAGKQGQLINWLTVVATLFLPLTFITAYFGMNFGVITMELNPFWVFVVLGLVLPAVSVIAAVVLIQRLRVRMGDVASSPPQLSRSQMTGTESAQSST
jgi:Mg2+ and Co2+ transporter CorA